MRKAYVKELHSCAQCPDYSNNNNGDKMPICWFASRKIILETGEHFPHWCHLIEYEEKIEANETGRVWVKIKGR
jgi:hypothetical protein